MSELAQLLDQHPKGVTISEIAARLGVTPRSARRYLKSFGLELEGVHDRPGGEKRWRIPTIDRPRRIAIRRTQAYALLATRELFAPLRGSALAEEVELAASTLLGIARRPGRGPNAGVADARLEDRFRYVPFAPKDHAGHAEALDNVFHAVADLRPLSVRYPDEQGVPKRRLLHVYALLFYKDDLVCLAREAASGVRPYRIDLMTQTRLRSDERFSLPESFRVDDYVQGQFGLWRNLGDRTEVVIDLDARVGDVMRRTVHPSQQIEVREDGSLRVTFTLADVSEVTAWVLGFGSLAEVIAPPELRARVAAELERAAARYCDD